MVHGVPENERGCCQSAHASARAAFIPAQTAANSPAPTHRIRPNRAGNGRSTSYLIRHLPVSSYPELPATVVDFLNRRGCLIPQTYEAHRPENVVHASLERAGSSDWAVLCSAQGTVSLLVFFSDTPAQFAGAGLIAGNRAFANARCERGSRLQLGHRFRIARSRSIEAQSGLEHRPPLIDHDALADSVVDNRTIYHVSTRRAPGPCL
jgi:hypothetical protein